MTQRTGKVVIGDGFDKTLKLHFFETGGHMGCLYEPGTKLEKRCHAHLMALAETWEALPDAGKGALPEDLNSYDDEVVRDEFEEYVNLRESEETTALE